MVIAKEGDSYTGKLHTDEGTINLQNIKVEDNKLNCTFSVQGYELEMSGTFEGDNFNGEVGVDYKTFKMTASRANK